MTQEVPSLFRDMSAPSAAAATAVPPSHSGDPSASDAAKEARLLSQLLLLFSVKRQHSAVAALFPRHIEGSLDGQFSFVDTAVGTNDHAAAVASHGLASTAAEVSGSSAAVLDAHVHPATDAALATSLLRTRPSERELVQQFLLLSQPSRNKVAQSLFVIPPSLLEDFAVILQFFLRVVVEAHSDSQLHHYVTVATEGAPPSSTVTATATEKSCSWAKNGDAPCVTYEPDESAAASAATATSTAAAAAAATTAVFSLPPGFHACLVEVYGSVHRSKCEEVWHGDHMAYRCRTCGLSDSSCMCLACFDPQDHQGHDFRVYRCSSGGCCDCGDPLAWKPDGFCKKHRPSRASDADEPPAALGALEHAVIHGLVRRVVAFCLNVLREVDAFCLRPGGGSDAAAAASSFDAFYPQSTASLRALPKTGRRRSSFPSVLQVHLDRLQQCLAWLQALAVSCVPYRQIVTEIFLESLPADFPLDAPPPPSAANETFPTRPLVILDVFLKAGVLLPVEMCDTLGVLFLKLLFDQPFKQQYTCHFVDWYPYFIDLYLASSDENNDDGMRNLSRFIDRLFCQLFHSTAQLRELERAFQQRARDQGLKHEDEVSSSSVVERLLKLLLEKLIGLFKSTLRVEAVPARGSSNDADGRPTTTTVQESIHVVDCGRNVFKKRVYARLCSDIRTLLVHPMVAGEVLLGSFEKGSDDQRLRLRDSNSVYGLLIQAYETLQQMDMQHRHLQQHIEFESQTWTFAFVVDYEMNLLLGAFLAGLPYCFPKESEDAPSSAWDKWEVAQALVEPLRSALTQWSTRCGSGVWRSESNSDLGETELQAISLYYRDPPRTEEQSVRVNKKSSFHLPLHHMFAAIFQGVCGFVDPRSPAEWKRLLFSAGPSERESWQRDEIVFLYRLVEHPLRVASFAREIKAGMWVRNGNVMWQQLVHYYAKHWRFFGLHGDLFVSQLSALLLPRGEVARMLIHQQLPQVKHLLSHENVTSTRQQAELLEETLRLVLQLVLTPLRYPSPSSILSQEDWYTWLLEREMKHWLCLGPFSRSEVVAHLDLKLVEQVRQMPQHEWFLLEEEEIVGHVLERVGEYDDPCANSSGVGGGDAVAAAAMGYGMKMSGTWRLKNESWREISPLFECFSPSEAQLCERNLKKYQLRSRMRAEDACLLPVPTDEHQADYFASAHALGRQVLCSSSLLAVVFTVLNNWLKQERRARRRDSADGDGHGEIRATSESLLVAAVQCLSVASQMLASEENASVHDEDESQAEEDDEAGFIQVEREFERSKSSNFYSLLCLQLHATSKSDSSVLSALIALKSSSALSPDSKLLAQSVVQMATSKSSMCREYVEARQTSQLAQDSDGASVSRTAMGEGTDKQQLAKEMMRQRQEEILKKMRSQQQKFLTSQFSVDGESTDSPSGRAESGANLDGEGDESENYDDASDDDACASTEYEDEDEDEDDEWGFPTGHIKLELYVSHLSSAVAQVSERERKFQLKNTRRLRKRTQSKARADSLGGADMTSSPSLSVSSGQEDELEECALCRLPCDSHADKDSTFGYVAMVQPTSLPRQLGISSESSQLPPLQSSSPLSRHGLGDAARTVDAIPGVDVVVWSCGHAIHHSCMKAYVDSLWRQQRASRNPLEAQHHHGDERLLSERDLEFLCPVCRRLSNCLLPDVTALLRPRREGPGSGFSLLTASSSGEQEFDAVDEAIVDQHQSFTRWLGSSMESTTTSPFASPQISSSSASSIDEDASALVRRRVRKFCRQLSVRGVRAAVQLPLLLAGELDDELVIDAELRHIAETWTAQFSDWQLSLRCLEVELDVTLYERALTTSVNQGASQADRPRIQSLRLMAEASVAAAIASESNITGGLNSVVASTSEVLFGRRVLFAEDDDEVDEIGGLSKSLDQGSNAPLLSHPHLAGVFSKRLIALLAMSATRCAGTSDDYRYTNELLSDVMFSARVVVAAQILQALCTAVLTLPSPSDGLTSPPRSPSKPARMANSSDFHDVESLSDVMQWTQQLMVRCRLLPPSLKRASWDMHAVEKVAVEHVLPLLRRIVLLIQVSLPRLLDAGDDNAGEPCALCDELFRAGSSEFPARATGSPRGELRALLRRLHLPPLRQFFRHFVFSSLQRDLCQLWAAQMESKAAVLRRRLLQQEQQRSGLSLAAHLVPLTVRSPSRRLFIDLPKVYMELFIKYNDKSAGQCQRCHQVPQHPAICLFCGDVLCCFSACCESTHGGRIGECTQHAQSCGLGTGAFLLLRACTVILFLGNERRCVWGSLYVDKNGEEDPYLRRGRTLFLSPTRLLALETLLVSHGFTQNTAILTNTSRRDGRRY